MIVAGVMSGTSADGIDVALVRLSNRQSHPQLTLLGHVSTPYPTNVRKFVLASMNASQAKVADLARLNFLLGDLYAEAVLSAQKQLHIKPELIGCHGQTIYHQGQPASFLGRQLAVTWQIGEAARIAARVGVPVVSDFRPADMAAGGKGAPLVPYLDYFLYSHPKIWRIALNIGGIANLTALPPRASLQNVFAFDSGPGNMVIDALTERLFGKPYDRNGTIAARGHVLDKVITSCLRGLFFRRRPPKTAGREEFGQEFVQQFMHACALHNRPKIAKQPRIEKQDVIATATALTVRSIGGALRSFVLPRAKFSELIVSGGGTENSTLIAWLRKEVHSLGLRLRSSDEFGIPSEAKEAVAFAMLAFETWNRRPSNVPAATGATKAAVLGKISYP